MNGEVHGNKKHFWNEARKVKKAGRRNLYITRYWALITD